MSHKLKTFALPAKLWLFTNEESYTDVYAVMHTYSPTLFKLRQCFFCYRHETENEIQIVSAPGSFIFYINRTTAKIKSYLGFYKIFYGMKFNIQLYRC